MEAYASVECLTFCLMYLDDIEIQFNRKERNTNREWTDTEPTLFVFKANVRPISGRKYKHINIEERDLTHFYVLNNYEKIYHFMK